MNITFISPDLTMNHREDSDFEVAKRFNEECINQLLDYGCSVKQIRNVNYCMNLYDEIEKGDIVVLYNDLNELNEEVAEVIKNLNQKQVCFWPVAMNKNCRIPTELIKDKQSFDVCEQLRVRNMKQDYVESIARVFSRSIISEIKPTLFRKDYLLFLSHRRLDGEEITANLFDTIQRQFQERAFRDVANICVGEEAQDKIYDALVESDILIFLHTAKACESDWIQRELVHAVINDIPILWIKVDNADDSELRIKPGDKPHIICTSEMLGNQDKIVKISDEILDKSFEMIMLRSSKIFSNVNTIKKFCEDNKCKFQAMSKDKLIYKIIAERKNYPYPQRPMKKCVQFFGRKCVDEDVKKFEEFLDNYDDENLQYLDSKLILSNKIKFKDTSGYIVKENSDDFYYVLKENFGAMVKTQNNEIVISGAFPDCDEIYKDSLMNAIIVFSKETLKNKFKLVFGAHPTFQDIIFEINKHINPRDFKNKTKMYISKFFSDKYNISELAEKVDVKECEIVEGNRDKSLSEMRIKMIGRKEVKALICLGGKMSKEVATPGIDEEIRIARENNIPVFLIGSVGGRSSELASIYSKKNTWGELNEESEEFNLKLMRDLNYSSLINEILDKVRVKGEEENK